MWQLARSDYLKLVPILALGFYLAFLPHMDFPYPVHIDEWVHLAHFNALTQANSVSYPDPFLGQTTVGLSSNLEAGFHAFWSVFHSISGLSWLTIFKYFPSVVFMVTILSVYILARREGFGWEAALFTCLIPTTVGILGPGFLVPVAMGLIFIPLSLFLVFNFRNAWSYLALLIFTSFLLAMHAATAVGLVLILAGYILVNLTGNFKHSLCIMLALAVPFLVPFPWIFDMLLPAAKSLLSPHPAPLAYIDIPRIMHTYGYLPFSLCLLGALLIVIKGGNKNYGLVLGLLALTAMLAAFYTWHYGIRIMYTRGLMYMMVMMSIVAGAGLMMVKGFGLPDRFSHWLGMPLIWQNVGRFICVALVGLTLTTAIPERQDTPYYYMINTGDYEAFVWIRDNVDESYERAILDPWKATAFAAITGKHVYTRIHMAPMDIDQEVRAFLKEGCTDTALLRQNDISIIYAPSGCNNPDLVKVSDHVYLLK